MPSMILFALVIFSTVREMMATTDKETDESWDIFIIRKINFGLWAVAWAGLWKKRFGPIMSNF